MLIQETYIDESRNLMIGESDKYEPFTDDTGDLFRSLQREYGRCRGKVYIDRDGDSFPVGWVFERNEHYEDTGTPFLRSVWVTLFEREDKVTRETFPLAIS